MIKRFTYSLIIVLIFNVHARAQVKDTVLHTATLTDSISPAEKIEDDIIEEIVEKNKVPKKEKIEYLSQLTRYGFKNLFSAYKYNPSLPYSSQVNPHAESYMQDYLRVHSNGLIKMKSWGMPYFSLIDNVLSQYGLPRELKYLAVIESNLSTAATSWVGAGGPWQFMPYTAREYGLVVNGSFDERRDYYKSTHAAAKYLLYLYKQMHDWLLVVAAYNGGPGVVYNAIRRSGSRNFWALQYYLPEESRNHVKKFIATHYVMEGLDGSAPASSFAAGFGINSSAVQAGMKDPFTNKPILSNDEMEQSETQTITGKYNSLIIAKNLAIDITQFNRYNPQFDATLLSTGQYDMVLPSDKMQLFMATKYQILNECVQMLLNDTNIPNNRTVYPNKYSRKRRS